MFEQNQPNSMSPVTIAVVARNKARELCAFSLHETGKALPNAELVLEVRRTADLISVWGLKGR